MRPDRTIYVIGTITVDEGDVENGPPAVVTPETHDRDYHFTKAAAIDAAWKLAIAMANARYRPHPLQGEPDVHPDSLATYYSQPVKAKIPRGILVTKYTGQAAVDKIEDINNPAGDGLPF